MNKPKLRLIETFSGIGMQYLGLKNSNLFDVESVATSDIDKDAIIDYAAMHCGLTNELVKNYNKYPDRLEMVKELTDKNIGFDFLKNKSYDWNRVEKSKNKLELCKIWLAVHLSKNIGDISRVNSLPECDMLTFSFPCQSISVAGKQEGIKASETRSGLVYEVVRLIEEYQDRKQLPKYLLLENVSALVQKKFINDFENLNNFFNDIGYSVYWKVLNAKECGIPQNRERVFGVYIRKDIDTKTMGFPKPFDNGLRLKDVLESTWENKYNLSDKITGRFHLTNQNFTANIIGDTKPEFRTIGQKDNVYNGEGIIGTLTASDYKQPKQVAIVDDTYKNREPRVYTESSPTLRSERSGLKVAEPFVIASRGRYNSDGEIEQHLEPNLTGTTNTLTSVQKDNYVVVNGAKIVIRKLTPKECFRLMGIDDKYFERCSEINTSDTHLYKQAGNGIVTNCIELIAEHLYKAQYDSSFKCTDENF